MEKILQKNTSDCIQCGEPSPPSKGNRRRLYCSKRCANKYHYEQERKAHPRYNDPTWKRGEELKQARKEEYKEEWEKWSSTWLTRKQVAEQLNMTTGGLHHRILKAEGRGVAIQRKLLADPIQGGQVELLHPETVELLKKDAAVREKPQGYMTTAEVAEYLGLTLNSFQTYKQRDGLTMRQLLVPDMTWQETHGNRVYKNLYHLSTVDAFIARRDNARLARQEARRLAAIAKEAYAAAAALQEQQLLSGLITTKETANRLSFKSVSPIYARIEEGILNVKLNYKNVNYLDSREVERYRIKLDQERSAPPAPKYWGYPRSEEDWTSSHVRERRLFKRLAKRLKDPNIDEQELTAIQINIEYERFAKRTGIVKKLDCSTCVYTKPYYDFYYSSKTAKGRGRHYSCVECCRISNKQRYSDPAKKAALHAKRKKNFRQRLYNSFITTIRQAISAAVGTYTYISSKDAWEEIKICCGYDVDQLLDHIESQFDENMTWDNWGRGTDQYYWQIDHIIPRSDLIYDSLQHPNFIKCWSLENLRPLEATENQQRYLRERNKNAKP